MIGYCCCDYIYLLRPSHTGPFPFPFILICCWDLHLRLLPTRSAVYTRDTRLPRYTPGSDTPALPGLHYPFP